MGHRTATLARLAGIACLALGSSAFAAAPTTYRVALIDLPPELGAVTGIGWARLNDAGTVAGSVKLLSDPRPLDWRAYRWTAASGFEISIDKRWTGRVLVRQIDAAGRVAATIEHDDSLGPTSGMTWEPDGSITRLWRGDLIGGNPRGDLLGRREAQPDAGLLTAEGESIRVGLSGLRAKAVNDDRTVAGSIRVGRSVAAARWSESGGVQPLGYLPGARGRRVTHATAINAGGDIVGYGWGTRNEAGRAAFLWTAADGMQTLPRLPGCDTIGHEAQAINAARTVVGATFYGCNPWGVFDGSAFIWTKEAGTAYLHDRVEPADPLYGQLHMVSAIDINSSGQILGWGRLRSGGRYFNFLLTPTGGH